MIYRFLSAGPPTLPLRLKVEINTREHFEVLGFINKSFQIENQWFSGKVAITTHNIEEILATKLRALYQRRKGRDLFDLDKGLEEISGIDVEKIITCFLEYMKFSNQRVTRAEFEENIHYKRKDIVFGEDISPLLSAAVAKEFDLNQAFTNVANKIISKLPGKPWKAPGQ